MLLFFLMSFVKQNKKISELTNQKQSYLQLLKNKEDDEAKLLYIQEKYRSLETFLKDDANSLPYYNLLNTALSRSSESASLKSFLIEKNREAIFTVTFADINNLLSFFRFIESEEFLKNFEWVSLKSYTAVGDSKTKENYELAFTGKFIQLEK